MRSRPSRSARRPRAESPSPDLLEQRERDVAAVERQQRQQVQERERQADQREHAEVVAEALIENLRRLVDDPDDARDVLAGRAGDDPPSEVKIRFVDVSGLPEGSRDRLARSVALVERRRDEAEAVAAVDQLWSHRPENDGPRPSRRTVSVIGLPLLSLDRVRDVLEARVGRRSTATITSPGASPTEAAGVSGEIVSTCLVAPAGTPSEKTTASRATAKRRFVSGPAAMTATRFQTGARQ